ncbi:MAG: aminopeptidase P family protein [Hyphomicrobiaceae bacterium]|nr:aminopeptidase P family protein [Hyphomicrobiaceae bacterium]MCC0024871.1 aminopeptidase P family protein [Hyphomicrobiaceae bacterium]
MPKTDFPPAVYQSFEEKTDPASVAPRIAALRELLKRENIDAFLVPRTDAHRGENVPESEERLAYITGFTGSAGIAVIAREKAALFVDGRYQLQAPAQTDTSIVQLMNIPEDKVSDWITDNLHPGAIVGYDPWLHTVSEIATLANEIGAAEKLRPIRNLIDEIWTDRPAPPMGPIEILGTNRAGKASRVKISDLERELAKHKADALVMSLPESICWLFNIRGRDVPHTPVAHSYAIVPAAERPRLYVDAGKLSAPIREALAADIDIKDPEEFIADVEALSQAGKVLWIDPSTAPVAVKHLIAENGGQLVENADPTHHAKTIKNEVEVAGMREAHHRHGVAMTRFLKWFDDAVAAGETLNEIGIVDALESFTRMDDTLVDIGFDAISGAGPDGAIIHYRVTEKSNRVLGKNEIMLVDCGGQYLSGTTDITRTMATGAHSAQEKDHFTRVLKGMIGISTLVFPKGTNGAQIDAIARKALWDVGLDYRHGTGHGVGAFLGVHESPPGIGPRYTMIIESGMILSNEPGYYLPGAYGIRIENLIHAIPHPEFENFIAFETLTLAPIDTRLVDISLLTPAERDWLNAYHARVLSEIGPLVEEDVRAWLEKATKAI